jgi:hypothetical protein
VSDEEFIIHVDDLERWLREGLSEIEGRPGDELTDIEAPDGHLKTVGEMRYDHRRALAKLVFERRVRESG